MLAQDVLDDLDLEGLRLARGVLLHLDRTLHDLANEYLAIRTPKSIAAPLTAFSQQLQMVEMHITVVCCPGKAYIVFRRGCANFG